MVKAREAAPPPVTRAPARTATLEALSGFAASIGARFPRADNYRTLLLSLLLSLAVALLATPTFALALSGNVRVVATLITWSVPLVIALITAITAAKAKS